MRPVSSLLLLLFVFSESGCVYAEYSKSIDELGTKYQKLLEDQMKNVLPLALRISGEVEISPECMNAGLKMMRAVRELKEWAVIMLDASAKIPSGLFDGTSSDYGDFDQCLSVSSDEMVNGIPIVGQYCLAKVDLPPILRIKSARESAVNDSVIRELEITDTFFRRFLDVRDFGQFFAARLGLCVPSACTENDAKLVLNYFFETLEFNTSSVRCQTLKPHHDWSLEQILITVILCIIVILSCVSTLVDVAFGNSRSITLSPNSVTKEDKISVFRSFSLLTNTKKMLESTQDSLSFLRGMRVLTIFWVVLGHTYCFPSIAFFSRMRRMKDFEELKSALHFSVVSNPTLSVDTFFVISGLLIAKINGPKLSKSGLFQWIIFIARRLIRILPAMALTVGLFMLLPIIGSGPLWTEIVGDSVDVCKTTWWRNFLFIQNFWDFSQNCLFHTWFLAVFLQFTIIGIFLAVFVYRKPMFGVPFVILITIASCIALGLTNSYFSDYPATVSLVVGDVNSWDDFVSDMYILPHTHLGPFCIGLLVGYMLHVKNKLPLTKFSRISGWCFSLGGSFLVICGLYQFPNLYTGWTYRILSGFYAAFHRTLWGLCTAWVCVVCAAGYGGHITKFLSWSVFAVLDKMTFFVYLLHPLVMFYYHGVARETFTYGNLEMVVKFLGFTLLSFVMAYFGHVMLEQPLSALDAFMFRRKFKPVPACVDLNQKQDIFKLPLETETFTVKSR